MWCELLLNLVVLLALLDFTENSCKVASFDLTSVYRQDVSFFVDATKGS